LPTWCSGGSFTCPAIRGFPKQGWPTTDYAADLVERLHIHHFVHQHLKVTHFACQHLKVAIDQMKAHYDQLANLAGFEEGNRLWLNPLSDRGISPKPLSTIKGLQCSDRGSEAVSCSWEQA